MPNVQINKNLWTHYDWSQSGNEWSSPWGLTRYLWYVTILPRISKFVPTGTILEIAPGFGRCTQYLKDVCKSLIVVDLVDRCIDHCRSRFQDSIHITYHVNDGTSLDMIANDSVDFAFSWDSLVHADAMAIGAYLKQLAEKFRPDGAGFFHHSNLGAVLASHAKSSAFGRANGGTEPSEPEDSFALRDKSMSAEVFRQLCDEAGLCCVSQELVSWSGYARLDVFSVFTMRRSRFVRPLLMAENSDLAREARVAKRLADLYGG